MGVFIKWGFALFQIALLQAALGAQPERPVIAISCEDLLNRVLARQIERGATLSVKLPVSEDALLAQFDPHAKLGPDFVSVLSAKSGVFRVHNGNGIDYVVRLPVPTHNIAAEAFNANFIRAAPIFENTPNINTPQVRTLSIKESAAVLNNLKASDPAHFSQVVEAIGRNSLEAVDLKAAQLSVTVFYPEMKTGVKHLAENMYDRFRTTLLEWARSERQYMFKKGPLTEADQILQKTMALQTEETLTNEWNKLSDPQKELFIADFKTLFPSAEDHTPQNFFPSFLKALSKTDAPVAYKLQRMQLERSIDLLPARLRHQLADYWALYSALGIPDAHFSNWLIFEDAVLAVDLGHPPQQLLEEEKLGLPFQMIPYGIKPNDKLIAKLVSDVSDEMKAYLVSLTPEKIEAIAEQGGSTVSKQRVDDILKHIALIVKGANP